MKINIVNFLRPAALLRSEEKVIDRLNNFPKQMLISEHLTFSCDLSLRPPISKCMKNERKSMKINKKSMKINENQ